jgi:DNA-binding transcriptional MerR regulator/methylmalonyl-CoA mutase cobalamin-binding subunit
MENRLSLNLVSKRTGISPQLIRTWEKRYQAVTPQRSATNRRLYSDADLEKLLLLKRATAMGLAISAVANLSIEELHELVDRKVVGSSTDTPPPLGNDAAGYHLENCLRAIGNFDYAGLESALLNASSALGSQQMVETVIHPLMEKTGAFWLSGEFKIAQEHMASTIVRSLLGNMLVSARSSVESPRLVATTPSHQMHELGALMSAVTATSLGWAAYYLGPNLPVEEVADAALRHNADAIALSITYPTTDPLLSTDLQRLRKIVGADIPILIGGQGADNFITCILEIGAIKVSDLSQLKTELARISSRD